MMTCTKFRTLVLSLILGGSWVVAGGAYYPIADDITRDPGTRGQLGDRPATVPIMSPTLKIINESPRTAIYREATIYMRGSLPSSYNVYGSVSSGETAELPWDAYIATSWVGRDATIYDKGWLVRDDGFARFPQWGVTYPQQNHASGAPSSHQSARPFWLGAPFGYGPNTVFVGRTSLRQFSPQYQLAPARYGEVGAALDALDELRVQRHRYEPRRNNAPWSQIQDRATRDKDLPKGYRGGPYSGRLD